MRRALLEGEAQEKDSARIIVVNVDDNPIGLVVDAATDVLDIPADSIQKPNLSGNHKASCLMGIAKLSDRLLILIDINEFLQNFTSLDQLKKTKTIEIDNIN